MRSALKFLKLDFFVMLLLILVVCINVKIVGDTFFVDNLGNMHSTVEGYGDVPLHLTQITKFASLDFWDLSDPIFYGSKLQYPFVFNFLRGALYMLTDSLYFSVLWPLYFIVTANIFLIFYIYKFLLKNKLNSIFALLIFFFGSGLNWYYSFFKEIGFSSFHLNLEYPLQNIAFGPTMISIVHQHTFHWGLFLFLSSVVLLYLCVFQRKLWQYILLFVSLSILPMSHSHSFVALFIYATLFTLVIFYQYGFESIRRLVVVYLASFFTIIPQVIFLMSDKVHDNFIMLRLGWMTEKGIGSVNFSGSNPGIFSFDYLNFIWMNFGFIVPMYLGVLIFLILIIKNKIKISIEDKLPIYLFAMSALSLFVVVNLIKFQPWDFDNNKIIIYFMYFSAPLFIWAISSIPGIKNLAKTTLMLIVVCLVCFSGFLDAYYRTRFNRKDLPVIFDQDAMQVSSFIKNNLKPEIILSGGNHLNPISSLAGSPVLLGYPGWLWTRGIDYTERETEIRNFYSKPSANNVLIDKYDIQYILLDDFVINNYKASPEFFDDLFVKLYHKGNYRIYSLK